MLLYLLQHPGEDVSKDRLTNAAWPNTIVEENNLNQAITSLRRALGDTRNEPRYIMTVAGRGYRFVAEVTVRKTPERRRSPAIMALGIVLLMVLGAVLFVALRPDNVFPSGGNTSIAVLPFRAIIPAQRNPALELGMADALISQVSEVPGITVRPLSTVARHAGKDEDPIEIGRTLGVFAVLEGTLQKEADRLRVTARLLRVSDGRSLWSGRFDEKMSGIFQVQDSIASLAMQTLALQLGTQAPQHRSRQSTLNADAYQLYASGIFNWQRRDIDGADAGVADFRAAIREDPNYALAWSALASVLTAQSAFGIKTAPAVVPEAKLAAQHAIDLDSELAEKRKPPWVRYSFSTSVASRKANSSTAARVS